jgi:general L-amino acid transport system permease protein
MWEAAFGTTPDTCQGIEGACWSLIGDMWRLFMVGRYPSDEQWRPMVALVLIAVLSLATLFRKIRRRQGIYFLWAISPVFVFILIRGVDSLGLKTISTSLWGGLLLTVILSVVGIAFGFPLGVILALGRRSKRLPVVKMLCVGYIELFRAIPIVLVLVMSSILLPMFLPAGIELDLVLRAQVGLIMFLAAYLAEEIRGGLQGIPAGQEEAAVGLGLNFWQTMMLIVMPQALRIVIPALVNRFIGAVKSTSLVLVIGLFDLLGVAELAAANPKWLGKKIEAYVFVAMIYWIICYSISRYSRHLEAKFKVHN